MNRRLLSALAIAAGLACATAQAQPATAGGPPPAATAQPATPPAAPGVPPGGPGIAPPPPRGAMEPPSAPMAGPGGAGQSVAQGQVSRLLMNPYGEVDGLRLADGTLVKFPPHMSDALTAAVKPGDSVRVIGRPEARGTVKADAIVAANGQTVYDQPPSRGEGRPLPPHLRAQRLQQQRVEGKVDAVLTGRRGEANGVILADGSIVRFPPDSLRQSVQPGAPFAAAGLGTRNANGTSLEATSLGTSLSSLQPLYDRTP